MRKPRLTGSFGDRLLAVAALVAAAGVLGGCPAYRVERDVPQRQPQRSASDPSFEPAYECIGIDGSSCPPVRYRVRNTGLLVDCLATAGSFIGMSALSQLEGGQVPDGNRVFVSRLSWDTGQEQWRVPLWTARDDLYIVDLAVAPGGDVVIAGRGYGGQLTGHRGEQRDGLVARFAGDGSLRYGIRLPVKPVEAGTSRYRFESFEVLARERTYVATRASVRVGTRSHYPNQLYAIEPDGRIAWERTLLEDGDGNPGPPLEASDGALWVLLGTNNLMRVLRDGTITHRFEHKGTTVEGLALVGPYRALFGGRSPVHTGIWLWDHGQTSPASAWSRCKRCTNGILRGSAVGPDAYYVMSQLLRVRRILIFPVNEHGEQQPGWSLVGIDHARVFSDGDGLLIRHTRLGTELYRQPLRRQALRQHPRPEADGEPVQ